MGTAGLPAPPPPRSPWQLLYGGAHRLRRRFWASRAARLPAPVVSVGNLHFGGAGKTPLVAAIAAWLRDRGQRVAILSRGYRGRGRGVRVVSTGGPPLLGPGLAGDEPVQLAGELPGVAVLVGADRYRAGLAARERLAAPPDLFLLDDGFAHVRLARDLDLLVFPAADPFAGGRLAPGGRLREPLAAAARADAVLLTGAAGGEGPALAAALAPFGFHGPAFASRTVSGPARAARFVPPPPPARVFLVAGIARPEGFLASARGCGYEIAGRLFFPDHHPYPAASLQRIRAAWAQSGAELLLATAKDRVKLHGRLDDLPLAELPIRAEPEPAFWRWLEGRLASLGLTRTRGAAAPDGAR